MEIAVYTRIPIAALATFILAIAATWLALHLGVSSHDVLAASLDGAAEPIIALSLSLTVFSAVSVPAAESIFSIVRSCGFGISEKMERGYISGCHAVSILSMTELALLVLHTFTRCWILVLLATATLASLLTSTAILVTGLMQITRLAIEFERYMESRIHRTVDT